MFIWVYFVKGILENYVNFIRYFFPIFLDLKFYIFNLFDKETIHLSEKMVCLLKYVCYLSQQKFSVNISYHVDSYSPSRHLKEV